MAIEALLPSHRQVFIDLDGPAHYDDPTDPVYPYEPPSAEETINQLAAAPAHSFDTVILSLPSRPRSKSTTKTVAALARLLASPACMDLSTLRIAGSLHLLNDRYLQNVLKELHIQTLILQETRSICDSYALAGLLHALNGITVLHISVDEKRDTDIHQSFQEEVFQTLSKLQKLSINTIGDASQTLKDIFGSGTLAGCEELDVAFQSEAWTTGMTSALLNAGSGFPTLRCIAISRWTSDTKFSSVCDGTYLIPLLSLASLQHIDVCTDNAEESIEFPHVDFLPPGLVSLNMAYAGLSNPLDLYLDLEAALDRFESLQKISLAHTYPSEETIEAAADEWEVVRSSTGHPGAAKASASVALTRFANMLELRNISFRLKLTGGKTHEERAHLAR